MLSDVLIGPLKSAMVGVFTPRQLTTATARGLTDSFLNYPDLSGEGNVHNAGES